MTDGHGDAPAGVRRFQRLAMELDQPDAIEREVGAAAGQLDDALGHVVAIRRVEEVGHPEATADCLARSVQVHAYDLPCPGKLGSLEHVEADAAKPEHNHARAGGDFGGRQRRSDAGHNSAAHVARTVRLGGRVDLREAMLGDDGMLGERGVATESAEALTLIRQRRWWNDPLLDADVGAARSAQMADAALGNGRGHDHVAWREASDALATFENDSCALVSEHDRKRIARHFAFEHAQVGVTKAGRLHLDQNLPRTGCIEINLDHFQRPVRPPCDRRAGLHHHSPKELTLSYRSASKRQRNLRRRTQRAL
jgi:hypothetical protein